MDVRLSGCPFRIQVNTCTDDTKRLKRQINLILIDMGIKRAIVVMDVITEQKTTFYNALSLEDNLISAIITSTEDSRRISRRAYRNKVSIDAKIERIPSKNGSMKVYSQAFDMIAYEG
tara:strand:- start:287 stop:640 length:354 start_codon:yes stop_codon:yes gene_type:complete